jgi:hypothetical protein
MRVCEQRFPEGDDVRVLNAAVNDELAGEVL